MTRITHASRTTLCSLALLLLSGAPALATPAAFNQGVQFTTGTQSLWGPGGSTASFGASGSAGIPATFFTPAIGAAYNLSASSGTVSGSLSGGLSAAYDDELAAPGTTSISLGFGVTGGSVQSSLGARANLTGFVHDVPFFGPWDFCIYCANYGLNTNIVLSGASLGSQRTGSGAFSVAGVGPDLTILGATVARAQVDIGISQTTRFTPQSVLGNLVYTHQASGTTRSLPFSIANLSVLDVDLDQVGTWDFSFEGLDLKNLFNSSIGATLAFDVSLLGILNGNWPFANLNLLNTPSFGLDFGSQGIAAAFSINVVPEPGTLLLLGSGLLGLVLIGRWPVRA